MVLTDFDTEQPLLNHDELWSLATSPRARRRRSRAALRSALSAPDPATQLAAAALATRPEIEAPLEVVAILTRRALHSARHDLASAAEALVRGSALPLAQRLISLLPQRLEPHDAVTIAAVVAKIHNGQILPALPPHPHDGAWAVLAGVQSDDAARRTELMIQNSANPPRATEILLAALVPAHSLPTGIARDLLELIWQRRNEEQFRGFASTLGCAYGLLAQRCGVENAILQKFTDFDSFAITSLLPIVGNDGERAFLAIDSASNQLPLALRRSFARKSGSGRLMIRAAQLLRDEPDNAKINVICLAIADALPFEKTKLDSSVWSQFVELLGTTANNSNAIILAGAVFVRYATFAPVEKRHELSRRIVRKLAQRFTNSAPIDGVLSMFVVNAVAEGGDVIDCARVLAEVNNLLTYAMLMRLAVYCDIDILDDVLGIAKSIVDIKYSRITRSAVLGADARRKDILVDWFLRLGVDKQAKL